MNCEQIQRELDTAFDAGIAPSRAVCAHVKSCAVCDAHQRALTALDHVLREAPVVVPAPALVARIQDRIASEPARQIRPWVYPVGTAAAVLLLAALGRLGNAVWPPSAWESRAWLPEGPVLPEWAFLKEELLGIPVAVADDLAELSLWAKSLWQTVTVWEAGPFGGDNPWIWVLFIACVATAFALDGMEWMTRRRGPGH